MNVAVIGASNKPDRYSYKAVVLLREIGMEALDACTLVLLATGQF